jgi:hypothetical protein
MYTKILKGLKTAKVNMVGLSSCYVGPLLVSGALEGADTIPVVYVVVGVVEIGNRTLSNLIVDKKNLSIST